MHALSIVSNDELGGYSRIDVIVATSNRSMIEATCKQDLLLCVTPKQVACELPVKSYTGRQDRLDLQDVVWYCGCL